MTGISKSPISRLCEELKAEVERFSNRRLTEEYPYVWLEATFLKACQEGCVVSTAVIAVAVTGTGAREVLGLGAGPSEDGGFWLQFLRGLVSRGLKGARLVISSSHQGLKNAIAAMIAGASGHRCQVHLMRIALSHVPKVSAMMLAATIRTVLAHPTPEASGIGGVGWRTPSAIASCASRTFGRGGS